MRYGGSSRDSSWVTPGKVISGGMHVVALVLVIWGLPVFRSNDDSLVEPPSIEVALISDISNPPPAPVPNLKTPRHTTVKPETVAPPNPERNMVPPEPVAAKPETKKPEVVPLPPPQKPAEPPPAAAVEPDPLPQTPPEKKPETPVTPEPPKPSRLAQVRPRTKPTPPKEPAKPSNEFDSLVRNVEQMKPSQANASSDRSASPDQKPGQTQTSAGAPNHNPNKPLSMSERAYIKAQIARNWNLDAGAKDIDRIQVLLRVELDPDGTVRSVTPAEPGQMSNSVYRAVAESAIRAVRLSSPLDYPKEKYETFKVFELLVKPGDALNRR